MNDQQLNITIAKLLGLDVLGEAPCWRDPETELWSVSWYENDPGDQLQSVYLADCDCANREKGDIDRFGHIASCLEVVPLYHLDDTLARQALEQICDERGLVAELHRVPDSGWIVELSSKDTSRHGCDKGFPLAIVKALAELESEK